MQYFFLTLFVFFFIPNLSAKESATLIVPDRVFHGNEMPAVNGEEGLGFVKKDEKYSLVPVKIQVRMAYDIIVDEKGEKTGKEVVTKIPEGELLFWLKNVNLKPKKKLASGFIFQNDNGALPPGISVTMPVAPKKQACVLTTKGEELATGYLKNYKVLWVCEGQVKTLASHPESEGVALKLAWWGDLNDDGYADFILNRVSYNQGRLELYLSQKTAEGISVKEVAAHETTGC